MPRTLERPPGTLKTQVAGFKSWLKSIYAYVVLCKTLPVRRAANTCHIEMPAITVRRWAWLTVLTVTGLSSDQSDVLQLDTLELSAVFTMCKLQPLSRGHWRAYRPTRR